jgi:hypothetical protein
MAAQRGYLTESHDGEFSSAIWIRLQTRRRWMIDETGLSGIDLTGTEKSRRRREGLQRGITFSEMVPRLAIDMVDGSGSYEAGNAWIGVADKPSIHHHEDRSSQRLGPVEGKVPHLLCLPRACYAVLRFSNRIACYPGRFKSLMSAISSNLATASVHRPISQCPLDRQVTAS